MQLLGVISGEVDDLEGNPRSETCKGEHEDAGDDLGDLLRDSGAGLANALAQDAVARHEDQDEDQLRDDQRHRRFDPATRPRDSDVRQRSSEGQRCEYRRGDDQQRSP